MTEPSRCPVCQNLHGGLDQFHFQKNSAGYVVDCAICGRYEVSEEAYDDFLSDTAVQKPSALERVALTHWVRRRQRRSQTPSILSNTVVEVVDGKIKLPLSRQRIRFALDFIATSEETSGRPLSRLPAFFYAQVGAPSPEAAAHLVRDLIQQGLVDGVDLTTFDGFQFGNVRLTLRGHETLEAELPLTRATATVFPSIINTSAEPPPPHELSVLLSGMPPEVRLAILSRSLVIAVLSSSPTIIHDRPDYLVSVLRLACAAEGCAIYPSAAARGYLEASFANLQSVSQPGLGSPVASVADLLKVAAPTIQSFRRGRGVVYRRDIEPRLDRSVYRSIRYGHGDFWRDLTTNVARHAAHMKPEENVGQLVGFQLFADDDRNVQTASFFLSNLSASEGWEAWSLWLNSVMNGAQFTGEIYTAFVRGDVSRWPPVANVAASNEFLTERLRQVEVLFGDGLNDEPQDDLGPQLAEAVTAAMHFSRDRRGPITLVSAGGERQFDLLKSAVIEKATSLRGAIQPSKMGYDSAAHLVPMLARYIQAFDYVDGTVVLIWSAGNTLRTALEADRRASADASGLYPSMPPAMGASLADLVEHHNVLMRSHVEGRQLEEARLGPRDPTELGDAVNAATAVVQAFVAAPNIIDPDAARALARIVQDGADAIKDSLTGAEETAVVATDSVSNAIREVVQVAIEEALPTAAERSIAAQERMADAIEAIADKKDRSVWNSLKVTAAGAVGGVALTFITVNGQAILAFADTVPHMRPIAEFVRNVLRTCGVPI